MIALLAASAMPVSGQNAQQIQDAMKMGENQLIEDAVKDGFVVMNTYYALQTNNGKKYGRDGHDFFGHSCYVGYSLPQGYVTMAEAMNPWEKDEMYESFRDEGKYTPVLLDSIMIRTGNGSGTLRGSVNSECMAIGETGLVSLLAGEDNQQSLMLSQEDVNKGWLVFAMIPKDKNKVFDKTTPLSFTSKVFTFKETGMLVDVPQRSRETIVGGIFVVPVIKGIGQVELQAKAFLTKNSDDKWTLAAYDSDWFQQVAKKEEAVVEEAAAEETAEEEGEQPFAVPSKEKKKKKPRLSRID